MKALSQNSGNAPIKIRLIIIGIEGQLLITEKFHYRKWYKVAKGYGIVRNETEFQKIWRAECIGIGDKDVYEIFRKKAAEKKITQYPTWENCQKEINKYYDIDFIKALRIRDQRKELFFRDAADTIDMLRDQGVRILIVTHAPPSLANDQLDKVEKNTGLTFDREKDVVTGERKDGKAYVVAFDRADKEFKAAGEPSLQLDEVLVLDNKETYLDWAKKVLGMRAAMIAMNLPEHLQPLEPSDDYMSMNWSDIPRFLVKSPVSIIPSPSHDKR